MITLSKIAKLAHVSISTASKAFSGSREVNEQTRETIFEIAKEHGVFKKFYNAKYPHLVIAAIVPEFNSGHYGTLLAELQKCLHERGCTMSVTATDFVSEERDKVYDYYSHYTDVDGVILLDNGVLPFEDTSVPAVLIGGKKKEASASYIEIDSAPAMEEAILYFKSKGVTTVGYISERKTKNKLAIFKETMQKAYGSFDERYIVITDSRFEKSGYDGMTHLIERGTVPRAVLCGYDEIAVGAMRCLAEHGLSVPRDVALIGANDNTGSLYTFPALSTIDIKKADCAALAVETVLNRIFSVPTEDRQTVEAVLLLRESSEIE